MCTNAVVYLNNIVKFHKSPLVSENLFFYITDKAYITSF